MEPIRRLTEEIINQYNRKPTGWSVLVDRRGNIIILGPSSSYWLRLIWLNPHKYTGVGIRIDSPREIREMVEGTPPYGLRPLPKGSVRRLVGAIRRNDRLEASFIKRLLNITPVSTIELRERRPEAVLGGPVITHRDLSIISEGQRKLERKLALEAERLFRKRYPLRSGIYA